MNDFDLESELYAAMADATERLGPPALDLDRVHRVARRRRRALTGSSAATALAGVAVVAVAVGGLGGRSGSSGSPGSPADKVPPSGQRSTVASDPSGCDRILLLIPPLFTGNHKAQTPHPPTPTATRGACRTLMELPPYQRTASPPAFSFSGGLLPSKPSKPSPTSDGR